MRIKERLSDFASRMKKDITTLYFVYRNQNTPLLTKVLIGFIIAYALSPIDLIPDFVPVLGYLDDFIILPLLIGLAIKMIPEEVLEDSRIKAAEISKKSLPRNYLMGAFFVLIWIILGLLIIKTISIII